MHPNYHIHQSPKKITVRDENLKLAPSLPSHAQPKTSFRNSCDTAHTFFTMLSGNEGDSLSNLKGEDLRKDPQRVIASNKDIQSLLNNISSLNSKLQDAKKSLTPASSYNEQSSVAKKYVGRR